MRIVHVIAYYQPRFGYQETHLAAAQQEMGHEVFVVTSDRYHPGLYKKHERLVPPGRHVEDGVPVIRLRTVFEFGTRPLIRGLKSALKELRPDVIHCHDCFSFLPVQVAWLSKRLGCPLVFDSHAADFNTDARSTNTRVLAYALYRMVAGGLLKKRVYRFVTLGENETEYLCRELDLCRERVDIIRLGADSRRFVFDPAARKLCRSDLGIKDDETVVVHVGKICGRKGIELLMEAVSRLRAKGLNLKLLLVGGVVEGYEKKLKAASNKLGLNDSVIFKGHVERGFLPGLYSASDIAVWPASMSIGTIEAMSMRLPLVVPDDDYTRGLTKNGNGILFLKGDVSALVDGIRKLVSDPALRLHMGERSRELVEREFDWKPIARQFVSLYREAVRPGS